VCNSRARRSGGDDQALLLLLLLLVMMMVVRAAGRCTPTLGGASLALGRGRASSLVVVRQTRRKKLICNCAASLSSFHPYFYI
jgi:hypothetical protein